MAEPANENAHIKEVIKPEPVQADDGLELLDLDMNGIPDLLEDDEDVDAASDARRVAASLSRHSVTMTVDSTDDKTSGSSPFYVADSLQDPDDEEEDEDYYDEDDDAYGDEEDDGYEDEGPTVAEAFRPDATGAPDKDELPVINGRRVERRKKPRVKKDPEFDLTHPDYTFTITKGLTNTVVKRKYLPHNRAMFTLVAGFIGLLALLCFLVFSVVYMIGNERLKKTQAAELEKLAGENELLASKNNELSSTVTQLSRSVNRSIEDRRADEVAYEASLIPDAFPLSQSVDVSIGYEPAPGETPPAEEEEDGGEDRADDANSASSAEASDEEELPAEDDTRIPVALFTPEAGTRVIAAGGGAVTRVTEDATYGYLVMIDHRNGYQSVYRCAAEPQVAVGITVMRGDTLFIVEETPDSFSEEPDDAAQDDSENEEGGATPDTAAAKASFAYQILLNGDYINPKELMKNP